ncbi:hypothetical protein SBF1_660010 [Candidatus Desulfosporosinus infrequens]|uniref:Uncharacterized protein n=1 Tax=Candidatus Desulfosporosinus infrequens TaxID=2043169 RepID=A0A2U3LNH1_9FIRM|nr:hypothetical protein SBF1_660010 [Candidatus Desulfosporosinus infrequens]
MASIEILDFLDQTFANQGVIKGTGEGVSTGKFYKTKAEAIQDIISLIEKKLSNDEWVIQVQNLK